MKMMTEGKSIKLNIIWNGILSVTSILFPFITFPYVSRTLGVEVNGAINFTSSFVSYFALFATLGLSSYGVKVCAQVKESKKELSKVVHELLLISGIASIIVLCCLYLGIFFVPKLNAYASYLIVYSFNIVFNVLGINWMYQGIEEYRYVTTRTIVIKTISIILMFLFVKSPKDGLLYAVLSVFASVGGNIINIIYSKKYIDYKYCGNYQIKRHIRPLMILFATNLAVNVYTNLDSVMLGILHDDYATGIYYVAVKIKTILVTLISSFSVVIMSRLSYENENGHNNEMIRILKKSYSLIVFITIPVVVFFAIFARHCIILLSGNSYVLSVTPMIILLPTLFFSAISQILGSQYSVSVGKEKNLMIAVSIGAGINLISNLFLIPKLSFIGASIGTLFAEIIQCLIQILLAREVVAKIFQKKNIFWALAGTMLSVLMLAIFQNIIVNLPIFVALVCGAVIFGGTYIFIMRITRYDVCCDICAFVKKCLVGRNEGRR